jgi:lysophospholipase L1-like esterase
MGAATAPNRDRSFAAFGMRLLKRIGVAFLVVVVIPALILLVGEIAARLAKGSLTSSERPQFAAMLTAITPSWPDRADAHLGWVPRSGYSSADNPYKTLITVDADGFRSNGPAADIASSPTIVAVGDSFTWGTGVSDDNTWPAHLERKTGIRIRNGGVAGYGFDQTVLRAEAIMQQLHVDWLLVSLIPDDVQRCEISFKGAHCWKPWFTLDTQGLILHEPPIGAMPPESDSVLYRTIEHSFLADAVMSRLMPVVWQATPLFERRTSTKGSEIAPLLVQRLASTAARHNTRLLLILQGEPQTDFDEQLADIQVVRAAAEQADVPTLDLIAGMQASFAADPQLRAKWLHSDGSHLTSWGYHWVAKQVKAKLAEIEAQ